MIGIDSHTGFGTMIGQDNMMTITGRIEIGGTIIDEMMTVMMIIEGIIIANQCPTKDKGNCQRLIW